MTNPFMRVDISQGSKDFQPVVLEPGLPLLDRSNSNGQVLRRWLGSLVAESERIGDKVAFYARDDESRRIDGVSCIPVKEADLSGELSKQLNELQRRFDSAKAQSATEQLILRVVSEQIRGLASDNSQDRRACLFKFRDGKNKLHLVWAPGYRRRDNEPATARICTSPTCSHLFLQRQNSRPNCHFCQAAQSASDIEGRSQGTLRIVRALIALACLIAMAIGGAIWWRHEPEPINHQSVTTKSDSKLTSLRLVSGQGDSTTIPVGAEFSDWKLQAVVSDGTLTDVSQEATLIVDNDPALSLLSHALLAPSREMESQLADESKKVSVAIRGGCVVGISPGQSTVHAVYGGLRTLAGLVVTVTSDLDVDEIQVVPENVNLVVGECAMLKAIGLKSGKSVGDISSRGEVRWKCVDEKFASMDGPQIIARSAGFTKVIASIGELESSLVKASVIDPDPERNYQTTTGSLTVHPPRLQMNAGQVLQLGHEVHIRRQLADFSDSCEVVTANRLVDFDESSRTLRAISPGDSRVTFIVRDQHATLEIDVKPFVEPPANSSIVIEPSNGNLAVGEKMPLRAFVVTPDGVRMPSIAALSSGAPEVATVIGSMVLAAAPGKVAIKAVVPGIDQVGSAVFTVEPIEFDRLAFTPASMRVAVGQRLPFEVFGVSHAGRIRLGGDSNLQLVQVTNDGTEVGELSGTSDEIFGENVGNGGVVAKWKSNLQKKMAINVEIDPVIELLILPSEVKLAENSSVDYQIMARREGRLQPLNVEDGIELIVDNSHVARVRNLRVTANMIGKTQVIAQYGDLKARAELTVTARSDSAEQATPKSLRFLTGFLQMELGDVGGIARVVQVSSDGREEDVDGRVKLAIQGDQDVLEIEVTAAGLIFHPKKVGAVSIDASLGDLSSLRPFHVEVFPQTPREPELRARPELLRILVGETKKFHRAEILPVSSGRPLPVAFTVRATSNKYIEVGQEGSVHGLAPGVAVVTIAAEDPSGKHAEIETVAVIEVVEANSSE